MEVKRRYTILFLTKLIKRCVYPVMRLKNFYKKPIRRQLNILIILLILVVAGFTLMFLLWGRPTLNKSLRNSSDAINVITTKKYIKGSPMRHVPLNKIYKNIQDDNDTFGMMSDHRQVNMLDTPGCKIPIAMINYGKYLNTNKSSINRCKDSCGERALFLHKESGNRIRVYMDNRIMNKYLSHGGNYYCCYRSMRNRAAIKKINIQYTVCRKIKHGNVYRLDSDFVNVKCFEYDNKNISHTIYDDFYGFTKKIKINEFKEKLCDVKYNVLMIGMNSMSLPRIVQLMPRTIKYFKDNFWLGFRGYHKIGDQTLSNVMALLTGKNSSMGNKCRETADKCRASYVWDLFKRDGYVTAFGEDSTSIKNTFNDTLLAFNEQPTDHYMNPLLITRAIKSKHKSILCSGQVSYGQQLLDYALDFVDTYKKQHFFGMFWMDSHSSDIDNCPQDSDKMFEDFFFKLSYTGSLENTFVIFLSDQGIRYGDERMEVESYYDERMPFLFMWIPTYFKGSHPQKLRFLVTNQFRLITPYDLYKTLIDIKDISTCYNSTNSISNTNVTSQSVLKIISEYRTCDDVKIHMKWCSCHNLFPLSIQDNDGIKAIAVVISLINSILKNTQTDKCYDCLRLYLKRIIRIHFYYNKDSDSIFYVVAFTVLPGEMSYEATVSRKVNKMDVIKPISLITPYRNIGHCALKPRDRMLCVCKKVQNCSLY